MANCCDRCKSVINPKETCTVTFEFKFRERVKSYLLSVHRRINGQSEYDDITATGKVDMCANCRESLKKFLNGADVVKS
ncbi:uncharacterized protein KNN_02295 [Bacillus thuringiensis serovar tolworthi]|uniref:Uncharacterized protein n=1 Tax=Bacillus thuringiensis subsp. tolworthi TaxID=1442 RepID=A0A9W4ETE3_BACTO|nr:MULTISPECIES: hypothetical protein [Bacillus cereus group]MEB8717482.1 hypothetical protein [Bacillus cereus]MRB06661.1 hypothetical protein [Bacillus thuringiensis]MEB9436515.1 hypothetical protein [Bacillus cereus]MEB9482717.1 hypothetical protein [Bacillus cereus]MEB9594480.1 hypothetical protein [Bacillus cereus]